ncbi:sodium:calcium antiporter [Rhodoferax sp.]|uniref:sodium:calcium antiporter n=1 Tax=Rhodoferax sp. TaxID=50421 RepID=UPI002751C734|nr:sodium:calcium antiporter [Rhodoferax sp.]
MTASLATPDALALAAAIPAAALGGVAFLKGVLGVAQALRVPKFLVATTLAAFATSSPELAVSSLAALAGKPEIGLGNALGSNVVNAGLILGLALLFGALAARLNAFKRDFVLALCVPVLTLVLALDGSLSRADGALLLTLFALWMTLVVRQAMAHRREAMPDTDLSTHPMRAWLLVLVGFASLTLAGRLFVSGASAIAVALGVHAYLIGATVIAIGTTLPELVTMLLSRLRGEDDVGLGTLLGSNLFNGLAIVGLAATIHPIDAPLGEVAVALVFGVLTVLLMLPRAGVIARWRGLALLAAYAVFILVTVSQPL